MSEIVCVRPRWTAVETAWPEVVLTVCHAPPPGGGGAPQSERLKAHEDRLIEMTSISESQLNRAG